MSLNTREKIPDDRYHGVDFFNGGLFAEPARVELRLDEVGFLKAASQEHWSKVGLKILDTLFQHSLGKLERRAFGVHFAQPTNMAIPHWEEAASSLTWSQGTGLMIE